MSTVAGLPKFMVLKSKSDGKYLHYLWNDDSFGLYVNDLGCKRLLDPLSPFVKLEVVPSGSDPAHLIHLRCCHNNKFVQLDSKYGVSWISATANGPDESTARSTCTLFRPILPPGEPNTVGLLHVQTNCHVRTYFNQGYNDDINGVACAYSNDGQGMHRFEFAAWESYDEKMASKEGEIRQLRASNAANVSAKDGEIQKLRASYEEKMKAKGDEIQKLKSQGKGGGGGGGGGSDECLQADEIVAELRMEIAELRVQLEDACREIDELKAASG
ncbi:unnamed protein product [Linum tenue]|uniref:Agglutinin domain-containing protein n=1 Tax=Linum tenue TaxID=586396 RepID=A0AAV0L360_9ROSI|nr:unnamed protein product [Linum tenue]